MFVNSAWPELITLCRPSRFVVERTRRCFRADVPMEVVRNGEALGIGSARDGDWSC